MRIFHRHDGRLEGGPDRAYVSEFTHFIDDFMTHHPKERDEQREGWRIYWDKKVDLHRLAEEEQSTVPTEAYYYYGDEMWRPPHH